MTRVSISASPAGILTFVMLDILDAENALARDKAIMKVRQVSRPSQKPENPGIEPDADRIQTLVDGDRTSFVRRARRLQNSAAVTLKAADVRDKACQSCQLHYCYPDDKRALEAAKRDGIVDSPAATIFPYLKRSRMFCGTTSLLGLSQSFSKFCSQFFAHGRPM